MCKTVFSAYTGSSCCGSLPPVYITKNNISNNKLNTHTQLQKAFGEYEGPHTFFS